MFNTISSRVMLLLLGMILLVGCKPNQYIGAGGFGFGCGSNSPLAQLPYGMMRLGPDTTPPVRKLYKDFQHYGGYSTDDHYIRGFSHMHLVGAGVLDLGVLAFLPTKDKHPKIPKDRLTWFNKMQEYAEPGYYKSLIEGDILVQLTASLRAGLHRYTFDKGQATVYIITSYFLQKKNDRTAECTFVGSNALQGKVYMKGSFSSRFGGLTIYFHVEWQGNVTQKGMWQNGTISDSMTHSTGNESGAYLVCGNNTTLYVGISYVSIDNAKQNLYKQTSLASFDNVLSQARQVWKDELSRFEITAINAKEQEKIDTAIYRTLQSPTTYSDFNGQYLNFADPPQIAQKPQEMNSVYTDMSLWDVHRSQFPWILFNDPQRFGDIARSLILINKQGEYMPKWPFANGPTGCMIGAHGTTVLSDWIVKQAKSILNKTELEQVLSFMLRNANAATKHDSRTDPAQYLKHGYIGYEGQQRSSVSETVEYSYNDFCIAQVAALLNRTDVENDFRNRSQFYKNLWNNQTSFFEPKYATNGTFVKLPKYEHTNIFSNYYVEGNAWHYRFYVPHDGQGLINLFGGKDNYVRELEKLFKLSAFWPTFWLPNPYYWAGNEHDLFSVWMFSYANRSDLVQKYSRFIVDRFYGNGGDGLPGNDDYGTMSAWLAFASLGFYPLPGTERYILGSPLIHSAKITRKLPGGQKKLLYINVNGNNAKNYKVDSVNLNGKLINELLHSELRNNSLLNFDMSGLQGKQPTIQLEPASAFPAQEPSQLILQ